MPHMKNIPHQIPDLNTMWTIVSDDISTNCDTISNKNTFSDTKITILMENVEKLGERLEEFSKHLLILDRDKNMEERYPELKEAYDNYNNILNSLLAMKTVTGDDYIG